ncbi:MmpS family transport accessory protein [Streptomyces sp. NPDC021098]|uniref:MmpS family transport accessory protein n=1 Tax=unclassified Streptomyces TaxID=2593676 RepID=UPI0037A75B3C
MNRAVRTTISSIALTGLALGLSSCTEEQEVDAVDKVVDQTYEVTYEVTGKNVDSIEFHGGGGKATSPKTATVEKPSLPWKKTVTLRGIMPSAVMPVSTDPSVSCRILHEGKVIAEEKGESLIKAGGCVGESPIGS